MAALHGISLRDAEDSRQMRLLQTPLGEPGSGMTRYAAAMHFHKTGRLGPHLLEAYRICCKLDGEDPLAVAASRGVVEE